MKDERLDEAIELTADFARSLRRQLAATLERLRDLQRERRRRLVHPIGAPEAPGKETNK